MIRVLVRFQEKCFTHISRLGLKSRTDFLLEASSANCFWYLCPLQE